MIKRRFVSGITGFGFILILLVSGPTRAGGIGDAYLSFCRNALLRSSWMNDVKLPGGEGSVSWVSDPKELASVSEALVDAFSQDPLFLWMTPEPGLRRDLIYTLVRHAFINGGVLTTRPPSMAAALWFESERASAGPLIILLTGQAFLIPRVGISHTLKLLKLDSFLVETRARLLTEANAPRGAIYLYLVGVREEARGQGLSSVLISPILDYANATHQVVLLETHNPKNIPIYEHFGFEVRHQETVPEDAPQTTLMIREPRS